MIYRKENGKYYFKINIHGKQKHGLCHGAVTKAQAQAIEDAEKFKLRQELAGLRSKYEDLRFTEIIKDYEKYAAVNKTRSKGEAAIIKRIKDFFKDKYVKDIKPSTCNDFIMELINLGLAPASINKYRTSLCRAFNLAVDNGKCQTNPVLKTKRLRVDNTRIRVLEADEEITLFKTLNQPHYKRLKRLIILALNTGMRRGEITNLRWDDINKDFTIIKVLNSKSGKSREIPINRRLRLSLKAMYKFKGSDVYVFTNHQTGDKYNEIKKSLKSLFVAAELKDFSLHCCRHTFATRLLEKGVDIRTVQELLGHADIRMTERYTHTNKDKKMEAVSLL